MPPAVSEQQPRCAQQTNCFLVLPQCQRAMGKVGKVGKEGKEEKEGLSHPCRTKAHGSLCLQ